MQHNSDFVTQAGKMLKQIKDIPSSLLRIKKCTATAKNWRNLFVALETSLPLIELTNNLMYILQLSINENQNDTNKQNDLQYLQYIVNGIRYFIFV